jgi:Family of unknown function (DUF5990)
MDFELPIRVIVLRTPQGVTFAMQRGKNELLSPSRANAKSLVFDLNVRVSERKGGGPPNVLGPYAHGKPADRFFYLNSGTMAGQRDSCWTRRAKIETGGINWKLVKETLATTGAVLEVRIEGRAKDGGPCCATVPLIDGGWSVHACSRRDR